MKKAHIVITSYENEKVTWAESQFRQMRLANAISKWNMNKRLTKVVWTFEAEEDAMFAANYFINRIGFEYVHRI